MIRLIQQTNGRFTLIHGESNRALLQNLQKHEAHKILEARYGPECAGSGVQQAELSVLKLEPVPNFPGFIGREI